MAIEWVFFDWGGTLSDVSRQPGALLKGAAEAVRSLGLPADQATITALAGEAMQAEHRAAKDPAHREVDLAAFLADWAASKGCAPTSERLSAAIEAIGRQWIGEALQPYPDSVATMRRLRERGLKLGLVSNVWIPPRFCRQDLVRQQMADLLEFAVFSSEVRFRKPAPAIYEAAVQAAFPQGRPRGLSRVVFVGDSPTCDVIAPAALGMRTVLIEDYAGLWSKADYDGAKPDWRARTVAELPDLLVDA